MAWVTRGGRTWRLGHSLTPRILAVNVFAVFMLAGGVLYLDSYRGRLIEQRRAELRLQASLIASFVSEAPPILVPEKLGRYGAMNHAQIKLFDPQGRLVADSWAVTGPSFDLRDPAKDPFRSSAARLLDRIIEGVAVNAPLAAYRPHLPDQRADWPEVVAAAAGKSGDLLRRAPDRTVIISAAVPLRSGDAPFAVLQLVGDTRDITDGVRVERLRSALIFLGVLAVSVFLSTFLANTIVRPLRRLAVAAGRVRQGRARDVTVPRFSTRRDEIGQLARALSDMTLALRERIDATEAFAADVAHELKNPLASLRSAVDGLESVADAGLRQQLLEVIRDDVGRIDRLITGISDASRLDAELSRSRFVRLDLGELVGNLDRLYHVAGFPRGVRVEAKIEHGEHYILGEPARLAQIVRNLIDNAVSFSPDNAIVTAIVGALPDGSVVLHIDDYGPGVPRENREDVFRRFYSERPEAEDFGRHSGLGLSIVQTIVHAHDGNIIVEDHIEAGKIVGARFTVTLPAA